MFSGLGEIPPKNIYIAGISLLPLDEGPKQPDFFHSIALYSGHVFFISANIEFALSINNPPIK